MRIIRNQIIEWKIFLFDKERLFLFITLFFFFPSPFFYFILDGFAPTISLIPIGYICKPFRISFTIYAILFGLIFINVLANCYILKIVTPWILNLFGIVFNNTLIRRSITWAYMALFVWLTFSYDIYWIGDVGGGSHQYNIITIYKDLILDPY